jgi:uncharacterized membrane protein YkgB
MVNQSIVPELLKAWISHLPAIIAFVAALIVIMVKWQVAPRASLLAFLGVVLNLLMAIVTPAFYVWLPRAYMNDASPGSHERLGQIYLILSVVISLIYAVSFLLVFSAVYAGRSKNGA